jgi:hypothetical protein
MPKAPYRSRRKANKMRSRRRPKLRKIVKKRLALRPHTFVEKFEQTITLNSSTLDSNGHLTNGYGRFFKLDDIPQAASYKELFDSFIIRKVVAEIRYDYTFSIINDVNANRPVNPIYPILLIKNDHNDVDSQSYERLIESDKTRQVQMKPGQMVSHVLKPAVQVEAYKTALASAYQPKWNCELRSADSATPHYGLKIQVKTGPSNANVDLGKLNITYKMYFTMKNAD